MAHVVFVSHTPVGARMAAPAIRATELARAIRDVHETTVAAPAGGEGGEGLVVYEPGAPRALAEVVATADVVVSAPLEPSLMRFAARGRCRWIVDLLNPEPFEGLEHHRRKPAWMRRLLQTARIDRLAFAAQAGHAFACASERQRDMWLGFLAASRRLETGAYAQDPELRMLLGVVPSGVASEPPQPPAEPVLRGRVLADDARIMLWNGGVWDWLDAPLVVDALALLRERDPRWALVFQGGLDVPGGSRADNATTVITTRERIARHRLGPDAVHVAGGWVPYARRGDMLLEAEMGVCAHGTTLEARFSFRNRLLDCAWARRPVVCTAGDPLAEDVADQGWGEAVAPGDPAAFADAVARVGERGARAFSEALDRAARRYAWESAGSALLELIEAAQEGPRGANRLAARGYAVRHGAARRFGASRGGDAS